jgi:hypothetical protein
MVNFSGKNRLANVKSVAGMFELGMSYVCEVVGPKDVRLSSRQIILQQQ